MASGYCKQLVRKGIASSTAYKASVQYPESVYRPLYPNDIGNVSLAFVHKTPMIVACIVGRHKQWNILPAINRDEDIEGIFSPDPFTVVWTARASMSHPSISSRMSAPNVLINCIPGVSRMCSNKWDQYTQLQHYLSNHSADTTSSAIMPLTYELQSLSQNDLDQFKSTKPNSMWITKLCRGHGGKGSRIFNNTAALEKFVVESKFGANEPQTVVQEYIEDLMLLNGRKFDIRVPILVSTTNPITLYFHEGYLRVALGAYDADGSLDVHLTGTTTQLATAGEDKFNPEAHFWSFAMLQSYLTKNGPPSMPPQYVQDVLIPAVKKIAIQFIKSGTHLIDRNCLSCYQLIGLDFTLSSDGRVWFIESNSYIGMRRYCWMRDFNCGLVSDMLSIVIETRKRPEHFLSLSEGDWFGTWQLLWREEPTNYISSTNIT